MYLHGVSDAGTRPNLGQECLMKAYIEVGKANCNVLYVVLSVRAWCMCCGSVALIVVVLWSSLKELLGDRYAEYRRPSCVLGSELWFKS